MENEQYPLISCISLAGEAPIADVKACIASFKAQTYPYKELIIINNCHSQFAASELNIHAQQNVFIIDTPIKLTAGMARNHGIAAANGRILAQFDCNYLHHPQRLESQIFGLVSNEAELCYLTSTLKYSLVSGRASRFKNAKSLILNSMLMIRSKGIDYPNVEKNEEKAFCEACLKSGKKVVTLESPSLMTKLNSTHYDRQIEPTDFTDLTHEEKIAIQTMLRFFT